MIVMVDMGIGNLRSVAEAIRRAGAAVDVATNAADIERADAVILPGVGAFGDGMASLRERSLVEPIRRHAMERRRPLLGICLGMQLLADVGDEHGRHEGLGIIPGRVARLVARTAGQRVPNMGWCDIAIARPGRLLADIGPQASFYFAHSYHLQCDDPTDIAATIDYDGPVTAAIERGAVFGVQFHPEKSQDAGLAVLSSFLRLAGSAAAVTAA